MQEATQRICTTPSAMLCAQGQGVVRGYAIGRAVVMGAAALEVPHYRVAVEVVEQECVRLCAAMDKARDEVTALASGLPLDAPKEMASLLGVHVLLLDDPQLRSQTMSLIRERFYNAEWALTTQGQLLQEQFSAMEDEYLRERGADIRQVIERVLLLLSGGKPLTLNALDQSGDEPLIVVARDIAPADMMGLREAKFAAFLTDLGGPTSHTAIVARSMAVPAVVGLGNFRSLVRDGDMLIVDGFTGAVMVNPSALVLEEYRQKQAEFALARESLASLRDAPSVTLDGITVHLEANIELPEEAEHALAAGAQGIGLFRSEFLFMGRSTLPDEEEQFHAYKAVLEAMQGKPVTIRTLDIGADKVLDGEQTVATNPALGLRAVRYCLANPDLFQTQLRALLRASVHGTLRILVPMISSIKEVIAVRQAISEAKQSLASQGITVASNIQLGAMVEVPAIAIAIEPFAETLDFLSIGTNDLIQYIMAVDRGDSEVADLYDPQHPAVLRVIAQTINAGERFNTPVSVCGEMAGDPTLTRLLLGLGLTRFSMHAAQLLDVKREIVTAHSNALRTKVAGALNRAERLDLAILH
ncbi:MAG: phosphoenolpyruvate--protein phosphotransferase [Paenalcaligenes sp.]